MYFVGSGQVNLGTSQLCVLALNTAIRPRTVLNKAGVFFDGVSTTATPVNAVIARITNTPSGTSIPAHYGPNPLDDLAPSAATSALTCSSASPGVWATPPTLGAIVWEADIPPTTGLPEWFPLGQEIRQSGSGWLGLFLTAGAAVACRTGLYFTE
jgi:hypothetical protein